MHKSKILAYRYAANQRTVTVYSSPSQASTLFHQSYATWGLRYERFETVSYCGCWICDIHLRRVIFIAFIHEQRNSFQQSKNNIHILLVYYDAAAARLILQTVTGKLVHVYPTLEIHESVFKEYQVRLVSFTFIRVTAFPLCINMSSFSHCRLKDTQKEGIERRWFSFIAENLIMYTRLYYVVLTRLSRCDLTTYKISSMSYRLMQVRCVILSVKYYANWSYWVGGRIEKGEKNLLWCHTILVSSGIGRVSLTSTGARTYVQRLNFKWDNLYPCKNRIQEGKRKTFCPEQ